MTADDFLTPTDVRKIANCKFVAWLVATKAERKHVIEFHFSSGPSEGKQFLELFHSLYEINFRQIGNERITIIL